MIIQLMNKLFLATLVLLHLSGCLGGTTDIVGRDRGTFIGNAGLEHTLSDRTSIDINYTATGGSNTQSVGAGVQFEGTRITEGNLDNRYILQALSANYDYRFFNGDHLKLLIAPGIALSHAYIDSDAGDINPNLNDFEVGYGVKVGASLKFNDKLSLFSIANIYGRDKANGYASRGIWLGYKPKKNARLQLGFSEQFYGDLETNNKDGCSGASSTEECEDSRFEIESSGIHLGFTYFSQ